MLVQAPRIFRALFQLCRSFSCTSTRFSTMSAAAADSEETSHIVFSFGSNSTAQLRARLNNPTLSTRPATVSGWVRVFHQYAYTWAGCSASMAKFDRGIIHGTVTTLSATEKATLDVFEEGCDEVNVPATVHVEDGTYEATAIAYLIRIPEKHYGLAKPWPSEAYLCAVAGMLREHWPQQLAHHLPIRAIHDGAVVERGRWVHPNEHGIHVSSLQALVVELNLRLTRPWVMPRSARSFDAAVTRQLGVHCADELLAVFAEKGAAYIAEQLNKDEAIDFEIDVEDMALAFRLVVKAAHIEG